MKVLLIYDSQFGQTAELAQTIARKLKGKAVSVHNNDSSLLQVVDLLILASPTQGGRPTPAIVQFIKNIPKGELQGIKVAAFDTRLDITKQNFALQLLMKTLGYAAPKMLTLLTSRGGTSVAGPAGFIVVGKKGPLASQEKPRAIKWSTNLCKTILY